MLKMSSIVVVSVSYTLRCRKNASCQQTPRAAYLMTHTVRSTAALLLDHLGRQPAWFQ